MHLYKNGQNLSGLNHLYSLLAFSSVYHDFLEDDGWVVRSEGVDAIGFYAVCPFLHHICIK